MNEFLHSQFIILEEMREFLFDTIKDDGNMILLIKIEQIYAKICQLIQ